MVDNILNVNQIDQAVRQAGMTSHYLAKVDSTNTWAKENLNTATPTLPALVYTDCQLAGRGQKQNRWISDFGSLTFSFVYSANKVIPGTLLPDDPTTEMAKRPLISIASACDVCDALFDATRNGSTAELRFQMKWPNDVLLNGKKCCGILIETVPGFPDRLVIGVGINVNSSIAIPGKQRLIEPTSLSQEFGKTLDRSNILVDCSRRLLLTSQARPDEVGLRERFEKLDFLRGKKVEIRTPQGIRRGVACGLDSIGGLRLENVDGLLTVHAGEIISIQP
jgi:BirA family biotin operon repressor/biotin-[acetyl-CoA-carboxylase] ligase